VEDARRSGVAMLAIDVQESTWDCHLENHGGARSVRMGYRYVKGFGHREREALAAAPGPYRNLEDFVRRTGLEERSLAMLAEAGGFDSFFVNRRDALWQVRKLVHERQDTLWLSTPSPVSFQPLHRPEEVFWDYRTSSHSTRGHPLQGLRSVLRAQKILDAVTLNALADGRQARYAGLAICRQQPDTKTGVTFYTLEDETGFVNVVLWRPVFDKYSVLARTALLMGVTGRIQSEGGVVHLVADEIWQPDVAFSGEGVETHSFY
jgi:error-prone DNA polymerase